MNLQPTYRQFGDTALLISWEAKIDDTINIEVVKMQYFLKENFYEEIIETVPAYYSIAVFVSKKITIGALQKKISGGFKNYSKQFQETSNIITIPVCYEREFAPDMETVANHNSLSIKEVIALHTKPLYTIYFLGFLPGFPYLGGLPKQLHTPRRSTPRTFVEKGSVAIGGGQAGIYTMDSPGGWNVIGKTPITFFNAQKAVPALLQAGDFIKFEAISTPQMQRIQVELELGIYKLGKEVYDG